MRKYKYDSPPRKPQEITQQTSFMALDKSLQNLEAEELLLKIDFDSRQIHQQDSSLLKKILLKNLPPYFESQKLKILLNESMEKMGVVNRNYGDVIVKVEESGDGREAVVTCRSNGMAVKCSKELNRVKIGKFKLRAFHLGKNQFQQDRQYQKSKEMTRRTALLFEDINIGEAKEILGGKFRISPPSKILWLRNLLKKNEVLIAEEREEIKQSIRREAEKWGSVEEIKIPSFQDSQGSVFIKFSNINQSKKARVQMSIKKFKKRTVQILFFNESQYYESRYNQSVYL